LKGNFSIFKLIFPYIDMGTLNLEALGGRNKVQKGRVRIPYRVKFEGNQAMGFRNLEIQGNGVMF
jgi:hypothetical protein